MKSTTALIIIFLSGMALVLTGCPAPSPRNRLDVQEKQPDIGFAPQPQDTPPALGQFPETGPDS